VSHPQGRDRQRAARGPSGKATGEIELALAGGQALPRDSLQYLQLGLVVRRPDVLHARPPAPEEYTTCTIVAPDAVFSAPAPVLRLHRWIYSTTDGRIGPGMIGAWTLLLHTVGRRTSQRRTTALVFAHDGERIILAASNDGKDHPPAWFLNLCATPQVELARFGPTAHGPSRSRVGCAPSAPSAA